MSRGMEKLKQRILCGKSFQTEFLIAKDENAKAPKDDRLSDGALAWVLAKLIRERVTK